MQISGKPTSAGTIVFKVTALDSLNAPVTATYTLNIGAHLTISASFRRR